MYALDFVFDGESLSDHGFVVCDFNSQSGVNTIDAGVPITPRTVSRYRGNMYSLVGLVFDDFLEITFDICKNPCTNSEDEMNITDSEFLEISRWLLRHEYKQLYFIDEQQEQIRYYQSIFNIAKIIVNGDLVGLRLTAQTDKPYAYAEQVSTSHTFTANSSWDLPDTSNLIGTLIPSLVITCSTAGNLSISNSNLDSVLEIDNCSAGEVITIDGDNLVVYSSLSSHKVWEDFNYQFLKIGNTINNIVNTILVSLACTIHFSYTPIIRDTP